MLGIIILLLKFYLQVQSVRSVVVLNLIKKKTLWMFGSIVVLLTLLLLEREITYSSLQTYI